ncbi:MAG: hypothetical protein U0892_03575 [Pirellulales bacterium]
MKELRIGTDRLRVHGQSFHLNAYAQANHFFKCEYRPVLMLARNAEKAKAFADNWGDESIETDWRKLIKVR